MEQAPGATFEATYGSGTAGLVGTLEVAIQDGANNVVVGPTAAGIIENVVDGIPTGTYTATLIAPVTIGQYSIVWSEDGLWDPVKVSPPEDLFVVSSGALPPFGPPLAGGPSGGPCTAWTTGELVADCCSVEVGSDFGLFDDSVTLASDLLFRLSGRLYTGQCEQTVRPCATRSMCGFQVLSRGHIVSWAGDSWSVDGARPCGCSPLSRVLLPGYPVTDILEVKIDGAVVPATDYRLDEYKWLTAMNGGVWPACQQLDLDDTETGTFSVTYNHGRAIPAIGMAAAAELACEIYKSCAGMECRLPAGTTRVTRQGVTIERTFFSRDPVTKAWRTGLLQVDAFLNAVNPAGLIRQPTFWSPDGPRYARRVGA